MSAFNVLTTEVSCPDCGQKQNGRIQFKFGNTAFLDYHLGDTLKWEGNIIGRANLKKVKPYGIAESTICPFCKNSNLVEEFDIFIEDNAIVGVAPMESIECYLEDGNSEYVVLDT